MMHVKSLMTYIGLNLVDECNVIFILLNASTRKAMEDVQVNPMVVYLYPWYRFFLKVFLIPMALNLVDLLVGNYILCG
jgi:hypothetical protein